MSEADADEGQSEAERETQRIKKKETVKESLSSGRDERDSNKGRSAGKRRDDCHRGDSQWENTISRNGNLERGC